MAVYSEETHEITVGKGIDLFNHPARLEPGFCVTATNFVANVDRLTTRNSFISALGIDTDETTPIQIDTRGPYPGTGVNNYYSHLPNSSDESWPVAMYTASSEIWAIRQFNKDAPLTTDYTESPYKEFTTHTNFRGACVYLDRIYINASGGIGYMEDFDWDAGTYTFTQVNTTGPTGTRGLFVFKDRMWAWDDTKIFYTAVPDSPGAYAEDWDEGNFIVIGSGTGLGKIQSIIPVGTQLYVFTENGLYTVAVIGSPVNWVVRLIDSTVSVKTPNCAYEHKGIVFFVDSNGVWVTDGSEVKPISKNLEPLFDLGLQTDFYAQWKLVPLDDGLLIGRQLISRSGSVAGFRMFYTPLDNIAWTEFTLSVSTVEFVDIIAGFPKLSSAHIWNPTNFLVAVHSRFATGINTTELLMFYPVGQDIVNTDVGAGSGYITANLVTNVDVFRSTQEKKSLYAYLNYGTGVANSEISVNYRWNTETGDTVVAGSIDEDTVSYKEAMAKILGPEFFRHIQFELDLICTTDTITYDVFGVSINLQGHRKTPRDLS